MEIRPNIKLFDLLKEYPQLEEHIMGIAPPFKNLKNPILRRTVGKLATLEKVALVGKIDVVEFVNNLREFVGQPRLSISSNFSMEESQEDPNWIKGEPIHFINGTEMLENGNHPLGKVNELVKQIESCEFIVLQTNFKPLPLIDAMQKQNLNVFSKIDNQDASQYLTFFGRK